MLSGRTAGDLRSPRPIRDRNNDAVCRSVPSRHRPRLLFAHGV